MDLITQARPPVLSNLGLDEHLRLMNLWPQFSGEATGAEQLTGTEAHLDWTSTLGVRPLSSALCSHLNIPAGARLILPDHAPHGQLDLRRLRGEVHTFHGTEGLALRLQGDIQEASRFLLRARRTAPGINWTTPPRDSAGPNPLTSVIARGLEVPEWGAHLMLRLHHLSYPAARTHRPVNPEELERHLKYNREVWPARQRPGLTRLCQHLNRPGRTPHEWREHRGVNWRCWSWLSGDHWQVAAELGRHTTLQLTVKAPEA